LLGTPGSKADLFGNLTIDDPDLSSMTHGHLNYEDILAEMQAHNFHMTIAFIPKYYRSSVQQVVHLFVNNADRFSITQHGNNHDGYEFICFTEEQRESLRAVLGSKYVDRCRIRPFDEQAADIVEGKTRMREFTRLTGIPCADVMIFPCGISLSPTLEILKSYNYNATINGQLQPYLLLPEDDISNYDYNMRQMNLNFGSFASTSRKSFQYGWMGENSFFDFFIDKPKFIYGHCSCFSSGINAFNPIADKINNIYGKVEWKSIDYIVKHLYLQKTNDDGSIDVQFYGNNIIFSNETEESHLYHFQKEEQLNMPIIDVKVDGTPIKYSVVDDLLQFDLTIPSHSSREILITYSSGDKDFAIDNSDITIGSPILVKVHNRGNDGGPCPIQFFDGNPDSGQSIALTTIERIGPDSAEVIQMHLPELSPGLHRIYVKLDPHNVILEQNETNNEAFAIIEIPTYTVIDNFEYEDSPLNHGWLIAGGEGEVTTVYDNSLNSRVMQVTTNQGTGFRIDYLTDRNFTIPKQYLSVKIKDNNYFVFYVKVHASDGRDYYLQYTPDEGVISKSDDYIYVHIGTLYRDGCWHELSRDLDADLFTGAGVHFEYVKWFCIRGNYWLDELVLDVVPTNMKDSSMRIP